MPLSDKGEKIMKAMKGQYGSAKKAEQVFYASKNKGTIQGVESAEHKRVRENLIRNFARRLARQQRR